VYRQRERPNHRSHPWRPRRTIGNDGAPGEPPREARFHGQLRLNVMRPAMVALQCRRIPQGTTRTGTTVSEANTSHTGAHNLANPMVGCRVQQTCSARRGVNRRSREKRQGRNMHELWQVHAEGQPLSAERATERLRTGCRTNQAAVWERTRIEYVDEGEIFANPKRVDPARRESGTE